MRVNVYAEEMTGEVEIISKTIEGREYTAVRFPLQLPASFIREIHGDQVTLRPATLEDTEQAEHFQGPFIHRPGDDDSSAVTFWGKRDLRILLQRALNALDKHYGERRRVLSGNKTTEALHAIAREHAHDEGIDGDDSDPVVFDPLSSAKADQHPEYSTECLGDTGADQVRLSTPFDAKLAAAAIKQVVESEAFRRGQLSEGHANIGDVLNAANATTEQVRQGLSDAARIGAEVDGNGKIIPGGPLDPGTFNGH